MHPSSGFFAALRPRISRASVLLLALLLSACPDELGNGKRRTEQRRFSDFSAVDNDAELDVLVEQGETFRVTVSIDENLMDRVKTDVEDGTLRIRTRGQIGSFIKGPHIRITMPVLTSVRVAGDGDLDAYDFLDSETVELRLSGDGDLSWQGEALELTAAVSGDGDLHLEGSAESLDLRVSGDGDVKARACVAQTARVVVSGDGDASVDVRDELAANVSGDGDLDVYGKPHFTERSHRGDGDIHVH